MRSVLAICAALSICVGLTTDAVDACDCLRLPPLSSAVRVEADYIFAGRALEIVERSEHTTTTRSGGATTEVRPLDRQVVFAVTRAWRGVASERISVTSTIDDCMFNFEIGREYLVFARKGSNGRPVASICSRTSAFDREAPVLAHLGPPSFVRKQ
jgi:hypothetical protein